jgi:hypothetical protein
MRDDDYRSFAGEVRDAGGFAKPTEPFMEFLWANFFRDRINAKKLRKDRDQALRLGLKLAGSDDARHLPGWAGAK